MSEEQFFLSWEEFGESIDSLAEKIDSTYSPDSIVSISRGGDPIGVPLSHQLNASYGSIRARHYDGKQQRDSVQITDEMLEEVEGDIIVADDVADSGKTLKYLTEYLEGREDVGEIKTATLHRKPRSRFEPDFYLEETDKWIVYPWECD